MKDIEEKLMQDINNIVNESGIRVINTKIGNTNVGINIQIIIDSSQGITHDDCAKVSRLSSDLIKISNYFQDDYNLEVSSPGVNRQLFTIDEFHLYKGFDVKAKLRKPINNQKNFTGTIKDVVNNSIILSSSNNDIEIDFTNIKKANIQEI